MRITPLFSILLVVAVPSMAVQAQTVQSLQATVDGKSFVSDDDSINLIPVKDDFTLVALTAGASAWPPPKTPVDRLAIVCDGYQEGQPLVLAASDFDRSLCNVTFSIGHRGMGQAPDAEYQLDKSFADNRFEITSAKGKVIEGRFVFRLKDASGKTVLVEDGRFLAEDRQY